jgi:hypothetical protein
VTYVGKNRWAYLVILIVMIVILLNAEGCAEMILRNKYLVNEQELSCYQTEYYLSENIEQQNITTITFP